MSWCLIYWPGHLNSQAIIKCRKNTLVVWKAWLAFIFYNKMDLILGQSPKLFEEQLYSVHTQTMDVLKYCIVGRKIYFLILINVIFSSPFTISSDRRNYF